VEDRPTPGAFDPIRHDFRAYRARDRRGSFHETRPQDRGVLVDLLGNFPRHLSCFPFLEEKNKIAQHRRPISIRLFVIARTCFSLSQESGRAVAISKTGLLRFARNDKICFLNEVIYEKIAWR
jgi:hypothetical protein